MSSNLSRGLQSTINNTPIDNGKIRFAIDTGRLFLDTANERVEITDVIYGLTYSEIKALQKPMPKIYLASDNHKILNYDFKNEVWIEYGSGDSTHAQYDVNDNEITSYVKDIKYDNNDIVIVFGNGEEKPVESGIKDLNDKVTSLESEVAKLRRILVKYYPGEFI